MQTPHRYLLLALLASALVTGALHAAGSFLGWYDANTWFDGLVHLSGGVWVGFAALWAAKRRGTAAPLWGVLAAVLVAAGAWELFETYARVPREACYALDTASDLVAALVGGLAANHAGSRLD